MSFVFHLSDVEKAIQIFQHLQEIDPYRLDNLDVFSNLLFVKEMKKEMASLAHKAVEINKYRPETCCVVGNYYSIRADHTKAVIYFQRALKLDPQYLSAWTLMGHEFMEMKNINAAIQSYRKAVGKSPIKSESTSNENSFRPFAPQRSTGGTIARGMGWASRTRFSKCQCTACTTTK